MANKEINNEFMNEPTPAEAADATPKKKRSLLRRMFLPVAVLLVILVIAIISALLDGDQISALRRYLKYGDSAQTQDLYTYASHQSNLFEPLGEELLVVNPHSIQLLHRDGLALYELQVSMTAPFISVGTNLAAVSDAYGKTVYVLSSTGLKWTHENSDGLLSYCARINKGDYLAVTEQKISHKASVTVYDPNGTVIFRFNSHDHYLSDAIVAEDGKHLFVLALGESGGAFASTVIVYDLTTADRIGAYPLQDGLALDVSVAQDHAVILCDNRLAVVSVDGSISLNYDYAEQFLHDYSISGGNFCAVLLGRYQSSNLCTLTTFSFDGTKLASLEITDEVLDMSCAGDRLAILYSDTLVLYDQNLNEVARLEGTQRAGCVRMNTDGTALLIAETSAHRFLP